MVFVRFKGGAGNFTKGRIYIVEPDSHDAVDLSIVRVRDDTGKRVELGKESIFDFCAEAFAVVVKQAWLESHAGMIVRVHDIMKASGGLRACCRTQDGELHTLSLRYLIILDHTNLQVGTEVKDFTNQWRPITRIDESFWIMTDNFLDMVSLDKFELSVTDNEIDLFRMVRCTNDIGMDHLTAGNQYRVTWERGGEVELRDDDGIQTYDVERFEFV